MDVITLDEFCRDNAVHHVNYLMIDTEGGDLEVLKGAEQMLTDQRIDFVEVEASMHAGNQAHVPFELLKHYLESKGYVLFGIYRQMSEVPRDGPHLRRTNSTFISCRMVRTHRRATDRPFEAMASI